MSHRAFLSAGAVALSILAFPVASRADDPALTQAVHAPTRSPKLVDRDGARHPVEELSFFGITPSSTVVEIWPGGGYWTQILAPYLHDHGTYDLALGQPDGTPIEREFGLSPKLKAMLDGAPAVYDHVHLTAFGLHHPAPAPAGSADFVLTFRNLHNWMSEGDAQTLLRGIHHALKPHGILGIEDHRGNTRAPQDPKAADGYVRQDYAIRMIEKAGFRLVGTSEINANPRDTANWPKGVWTLPPSLALGDQDRAKYQAIGEADNFVLKFEKVGR